jgi:hypothetical protein
VTTWEGSIFILESIYEKTRDERKVAVEFVAIEYVMTVT